MEMLDPQHPVLLRFKQRRPQTLEEIQNWVKKERAISVGQYRRAQTFTSPGMSVVARVSP